MDFNKTINLPKTDFPMRAGLPKREPEMLARWKKIDIYRTLLKKNQGKPRFSLHDGPPFSNGSLHMGHALNKALKDIIIRSYAMRGYYTPYVPGWDNHGMPIESAIIRQNRLNRKSMSTAEFRSECCKFAQHYVDVQSEGFQRMGVIGDWEHPYLTMSPGFEAEEVKVFGKMYEKGYIYKGLKPVYWCPADETALAEAEIEYHEDPVTTVYVKFPMRDDRGKLSAYVNDKVYFLIWTTTIWTLPGNLAIALHPEESYALVRAGNGEIYILAEALTEKVMKVGGVPEFEILETHPGAFFENMLANHPFLPKTSRLLLADYVTMDSGTGCVHTAPGFGVDDYNTCRRYGMEMVVPVDDQGRHTGYAGKYAGLTTDESNPVILEDMRKSGMLFAAEDIVHSYPHCWRCKGAVIFRATPQWFCSVDAFKEEAVNACDAVRWVPGWGIERMKAMIQERSDWCISRQRKWGLPIPVFYCRDCEEPVCTEESIQAVSALFAKEGSNAWFERGAEQILPETFVCPHCGKGFSNGGAGFDMEQDTLDGWFDSGSTHFASMQRDQGWWPADMYLEGLDQYRGWFQSSLLTAVGAFGNGAPFRECVTHGWTVDGEGRAMHKSLGNGMDPAVLFNKYGADLVRLWAASADYHADVRCSEEIFKQLSQNYLKFRNTARYCLGNLNGFDPNHLTPPADMTELDRWALTRLNALMERCDKACRDYEFLVITHAVNDFCVVDMSNFYLDIIKDRLYCDEIDGASRKSAQTALFLILDTMTKIMAPILCFTGDEIWQSMPHRDTDDPENVLFNDMNRPFTDYALSDEDMLRWSVLEQLRDGVNAALETARAEKKIGKALEARVTLVKDPGASVDNLEMTGKHFTPEQLADLFIVSETSVSCDADLYAKGTDTPVNGVRVVVETAAGAKCERCWKQLPEVGTVAEYPTLCKRCAAVIAKM